MRPAYERILHRSSGYQGWQFHNTLAKAMPHHITEIVKRSDQAKVFSMLLKRWIVERTIAWHMPNARQRLGEPRSQGVRILAPRLNPPHVSKPLQFRLMFPDSL
jgi:hypothetical protein